MNLIFMQCTSTLTYNKQILLMTVTEYHAILNTLVHQRLNKLKIDMRGSS